MSKQLMIYERAVPISSERHREWSVQMGRNYSFAREVNSVPLLAAEFLAAAPHYPIVFAGNDDIVSPSVILGTRDSENAQVDEAGQWTGAYTPAFLRRYPFVFARSEDARTFTLCIDEEYDGFNRDGMGERMFDSGGNRTQFLENMLSFVRDYQALFDRTTQFCQRLKENGLLQAAQAQFNTGEGRSSSLTGFYTVDREKLKALPEATLMQMLQTDELELCYAHLHSLGNMTQVARSAAARAPAAAPADEAEVAPEPVDEPADENA